MNCFGGMVTNGWCKTAFKAGVEPWIITPQHHKHKHLHFTKVSFTKTNPLYLILFFKKVFHIT